jgi:hypothetical protein
MRAAAEAGTGQLALACERFGEGFVGQPANTVTSLAFVAAGLAVLATRRGAPGWRWPYAGLVVAVGVGSFVQHGPHPPWQAYAHDLPLATLLAVVAADAAADLAGRHRGGWWRSAPMAAVPVGMVPLVTAGPAASVVAQGLLATAAIGLNLARAWRRPRLRRNLLTALALLATGALAGALTDRTALCRPDSLLQGHAAWHLLAAAALWWLAPAVGSRDGRGRTGSVVGAGAAPLTTAGPR